MRALLLMFDSLNRHMLTPYGCTETLTPNFERLARRTVQFDTCYTGGLPCMPARRELHSGRYSFLHRDWGPLEPFDDSVPEILSRAGIHTHLISDHYHYWQDGGATYHTRYTPWEAVRGQEGDPWKGIVSHPFSHHDLRHQDQVNRPFMNSEENHPQTLTFDLGIRFLEDNHETDGWMLQIEAFDPHEPFFVPEGYEAPGAELPPAAVSDWPYYRPVTETAEEIAGVRKHYAALLSMCDRSLGRVLDVFDRYDLWQDTMLIVCTDHGFMLGEHGYWAKNYMQPFEEIVHTPLFVWDPRCEKRGVRRRSLVQTVDIPATVLSFFGQPHPKDMQGRDILPVMRDDSPVRDGALFGLFGADLGYTDGRYFFVQVPEGGNQPLYEYTLMPTQMDAFFPPEKIRTMTQCSGFSFTKGMPVMRFAAEGHVMPEDRSVLYDLQADPHQEHPILDEKAFAPFRAAMSRMMRENDAPKEQWERLGLVDPDSGR